MCLFIYFTEVTASDHRCLIWTRDGKNLTLTCRIQIQSFLSPVYISDKYGRSRAVCSFSSMDVNCISYQTNSSITADPSLSAFYFSVTFVDDDDINGQWNCSHGENILTTTVSTTEGNNYIRIYITFSERLVENFAAMQNGWWKKLNAYFITNIIIDSLRVWTHIKYLFSRILHILMLHLYVCSCFLFRSTI